MLLAGRAPPAGSHSLPSLPAGISGRTGRRPSRRRWSISLWAAIENKYPSSGRRPSKFGKLVRKPTNVSCTRSSAADRCPAAFDERQQPALEPRDQFVPRLRISLADAANQQGVGFDRGGHGKLGPVTERLHQLRLLTLD